MGHFPVPRSTWRQMDRPVVACGETPQPRLVVCRHCHNRVKRNRSFRIAVRRFGDQLRIVDEVLDEVRGKGLRNAPPALSRSPIIGSSQDEVQVADVAGVERGFAVG